MKTARNCKTIICDPCMEGKKWGEDGVKSRGQGYLTKIRPCFRPEETFQRLQTMLKRERQEGLATWARSLRENPSKWVP